MVTIFLLSVLTQTAPLSVPVSVDGEGYLRFMREGHQVFSKTSTLIVKTGKLAASDGPTVLPSITVTGQPSDLSVGLDGTVRATYSTGRRVVGRLVLASFGDDVRPVKSGAYFLCYGVPQVGNPGEGDFGVVRVLSSETSDMTAPDKASSPLLGKVAPALKETVSIDNPSFTLGDISDGAGPAASVILGDTPPVGISRPITRFLIEGKLKAAGFRDYSLSGAAQVEVKHAGQEVAPEVFVNAAVAKAKSSNGGEYVATGPAFPPMQVPKGIVEAVAESIQSVGQNLGVTVVVYVDGKRFNSRVVQLRPGGSLQTAAVPISIRPGTSVSVRLKHGRVTVETRGKVVHVDGGEVTVEVEPTKVQLSGPLSPDGTVEVRS